MADKAIRLIRPSTSLLTSPALIEQKADRVLLRKRSASPAMRAELGDFTPGYVYWIAA